MLDEVFQQSAIWHIFLEYQKNQCPLNWVWIGKFWIFPIVIKCALDFLFLPFFQKANNEGHSEVDFFILYQKTVSLEKSAFGKENPILFEWYLSLWKEVDCKGFPGPFFVCVQFIVKFIFLYKNFSIHFTWSLSVIFLKSYKRGMKWNTPVVSNFTFLILTNDQSLQNTILVG